MAPQPKLAILLCENSGAVVEWLMDKFNLDVSLVARVGGHSAPGVEPAAQHGETHQV